MASTRAFFVGLGSPRELHGCNTPQQVFPSASGHLAAISMRKRCREVLEVKGAGEQEEAEGQGTPCGCPARHPPAWGFAQCSPYHCFQPSPKCWWMCSLDADMQIEAENTKEERQREKTWAG